MRIGQGYDIHRLVEGRPLILGGIRIPYEKGLLGHSDADVLTHAIMDALLGAAALRDIGYYFPPEEERWKGADSILLLQQVVQLVGQEGWCVANVDSVVVAEQP
ncbi:2-C-methyl-D-erythritol 2,4-cyclodiphosphate synthase, partial [Synechococcus sp. R55.8]